MTRLTFDGPSITTPPFAVPTSYYVVLRPRPPNKYHGMIARAKRSQDAERAVATIGEVLAIGPLAWQIKAGDLDPLKDSVSQSIRVGDWVQYRQGSGQRLRIRQDHVQEDDENARDEYVITVADTDIIGKFADKADSERFFDYL